VRQAGSLAELEALLASFDGCALKFSAKNLAFADGNPDGRVMLVGEAPGADEDRIGKPFMGRSGQLLDRMLKTVGLDRSEVYIANVVPWRPPGTAPDPAGDRHLQPFIARQIELANPNSWSASAARRPRTCSASRTGSSRPAGAGSPTARRTAARSARSPPCIPAYLLRQPLQKRLGWRDFQSLRRALDGRA
jgi:DNA polymerase